LKGPYLGPLPQAKAPGKNQVATALWVLRRPLPQVEDPRQAIALNCFLFYHDGF
jgi:hypothetical protein